MANPWEGKHIWIWVLSDCGTPEEVVSRAVSLGVTGLLVKGWDGTKYWSQIQQIVGPAHNAGMVVGAWGYSYGSDPGGESYAAKECLAAGVDWIIIDAEVEYEQQPGRADGILSAFKPLGALLGFTSFGLPRYHSGFPWRAFSGACDVALPQVYWKDFGMPVDEALAQALADYRAYGLPIAPAGQLYGDVPVDDITRFADLSRNAGLPGISFYDWQHAGDAQLNAVGEAGYKRGSDVVSDWAKPSWDKATAKGILDGTDPQGVVTREMLSVVLDRCGLLDFYEVPQDMVDLLKKAGLITGDHLAGSRPTWGELAALIEKITGKK